MWYYTILPHKQHDSYFIFGSKLICEVDIATLATCALEVVIAAQTLLASLVGFAWSLLDVYPFHSCLLAQLSC